MAVNAATSKSKNAVPRYLQVAGELRDAIMSGRYASGDQFPTETVLCEQFEVSRFTVREALKRLENEGLIARRRGSGTVVQPAAARGGALHQPLSNVGELLQYGRGSAVKYSEKDRGPLPEHISDGLADDTSGTWRCFRGLRKPDGTDLPIAVIDVYFHERLGSVIDELDLSGLLFSQIERGAGLSVGKVTQDIQAISASETMAALLKMDEGDPILRIVRGYLDSRGNVFEVSVSYHPGDRFAYSMHIDLDS